MSIAGQLAMRTPAGLNPENVARSDESNFLKCRRGIEAILGEERSSLGRADTFHLLNA